MADRFHLVIGGAHAPSRAVAVAGASPTTLPGTLSLKEMHFGEGAEISTRGACAAQSKE
jgi:hypothetical protein